VGIKTPGLRFEFVDVLLGVGGMCILYKRETGAVVVDVIELDANEREKWCKLFMGSLDNRLSQTKTGLVYSSHAISLICAMVY
jgi:hypothetical protein